MEQSIQAIQFQERDVQLLLAQYLFENQLYQTLYSLQLESKCSLKFCCTQIDSLNTLFMSESYQECISFLQSLKQSPELQKVIKQLEILQILITAPNIAYEIKKFIETHTRQLTQDNIYFYQQINDSNIESMYQIIKKQTFQELQQIIYPYYNQYVDEQSVFSKLQSNRLKVILNNYYKHQLSKYSKKILQSSININVFEDLVSINNQAQQEQNDEQLVVTELQLQKSQEISKSNQPLTLPESTQEASNLSDQQSVKPNASDQMIDQYYQTQNGYFDPLIPKARQQPVIKATPNIQSEKKVEQEEQYINTLQLSPQTNFIEQQKLISQKQKHQIIKFYNYDIINTGEKETHKIIIQDFKVQKNNFQIKLIRLANNSIQYMKYTQECYTEILQYNGQSDSLIQLQDYANFFITIDSIHHQIHLYDINFKSPTKSMQIQFQIERIVNDNRYIYVINGSHYGIIDINDFEEYKTNKISFKLDNSNGIDEKIINVFNYGQVIFTNKQYFYKNKVKQYQLNYNLDIEHTRFYLLDKDNEGSALIIQKYSVELLTLSDGTVKILYDDHLKSLVFNDKFIYGIDNRNNIVMIELETQTVKISNYQLISGVTDVFIENKMLFWIRYDGLYGSESVEL